MPGRKNFRDLGHGYATDGTTVWFLDEKKVIEGADAATFTVPGPGEPHVPGGWWWHQLAGEAAGNKGPSP